MFSSFTLPFLLFFALQDFKVTAAETTLGRMGRVFIFYIVLSGGTVVAVPGLVGASIGLPFMFNATIVVFSILCLFLLIALEFKPPMKEQTGLRAGGNMLLLYLGVSFLYYFTTYLLPQYNPAFEIEKLRQAELSLAGADKPTIIKAGQQVYKDFECFNCHNNMPGGELKRGPNLSEIDMGDEIKITESMVDPYKEILKPYSENKKVAKSMPDYYEKQMSKDELIALVTYLDNIKEVSGQAVSTDNMPNGWWTDPKIVAEGQQIFEGLLNEDVACHVCHGKDGIVQFEDATDFRVSEDMINLTDARFFQIVKYGFEEDSPMSGWGEDLSDDQIWQLISYTWTFYTRHTLKKEDLVERKNPEGPKAIKLVEKKYWE
jgi:mono/diheme cytochrome c family protein